PHSSPGAHRTRFQFSLCWNYGILLRSGCPVQGSLPEFTRGLPLRSGARIMAEYQLLRMEKSIQLGQHVGLGFGSASLLYYGGTLVSSVARGERSGIDFILGGSLAGLGFRAWRWRRFLSTPRYWQVMSLGHFVLTVGRSVVTGGALGFAAGAADVLLCQYVPERFRPDRTRAISQAVAEARVGEPGWDVPRHGTGEDGGLGDAHAEGMPESSEAELGSSELEVSPVPDVPSQSKVRRLGSWIKSLVWRGGGAKEVGQSQNGRSSDVTNLITQLEASKTR
ncbi:hypothetical protein H632_c1852p0, partial [Helicosporidium sp. ATCC 50920]